jgi:membrane protein
VPAVALALGIAKGFGLEDTFERVLLNRPSQQDTTVESRPGVAGPQAPAALTEGQPTPEHRAPQPAASPDRATPRPKSPGAVNPAAPSPRQESALEEARSFVLEDMAPGQREAIEWIVSKADKFLKNMSGSLIAGIGIAFLFWIVIVLLANIEGSFNDIWKIRKGRRLMRKISDYLSVAVICPVLLILSGSLTVYVTREVAGIARHHLFVGALAHVVLSIVPYLVLWLLFTFLYMLMPNTRVPWKAGLVGGIIGGTLYQVIQWAYVHFQIGVAHANAVFGSVAALPLFLVWLQMSWLVVLFGAEICFAIDDEETYEPKRDFARASRRFRNLLALRIAQVCVKRFCAGEKPPAALELCHQLGAPLPLVEETLSRLVETEILAQSRKNSGDEEYYQPAHNVERITIREVLGSLEARGNDSDHIINEGEFDALAAKLERMERHFAASPDNMPLRDF